MRIQLYFAAAALGGGLVGMAWPLPEPAFAAQTSRLHDSIRSWSDTARRAAEDMIAIHGPPDDVEETMLAWNGRARWRHVLVFRDPVRASAEVEPHHIVLVEP